MLLLGSRKCPDYRGVLISQVHLYCNGTTTDCPYYRGVRVSTIAGFVVQQNYVYMYQLQDKMWK